MEQKCLEGIHPRILVTDEFIERNHLRLVRTPAAVLERIKKNPEDVFGFCATLMIDYLPWEDAKTLYTEDFVQSVEEGKEPKPRQITDVREAVQDMLDYMVFGWMKAMDERGLSASRTIDKISSWLWLLGREDLAELVYRDSLYNPYGMPALIAVCENLGIIVPDDCRDFAARKV